MGPSMSEIVRNENCPYRKRGDYCLHSKAYEIRRTTFNWPKARITRKHYLRITEYCNLTKTKRHVKTMVRECFVVSTWGIGDSYRNLNAKDNIR